MGNFTVENPNKWLAHVAEKYPDDAAGFDDVSDYIDHLRFQLGVARNHLDQIIGTARVGINRSAPRGRTEDELGDEFDGMKADVLQPNQLEQGEG